MGVVYLYATRAREGGGVTPRRPIGNRLRASARGEADFTSERDFDHERRYGLPVAPAYWSADDDEPPRAVPLLEHAAAVLLLLALVGLIGYCLLMPVTLH